MEFIVLYPLAEKTQSRETIDKGLEIAQPLFWGLAPRFLKIEAVGLLVPCTPLLDRFGAESMIHSEQCTSSFPSKSGHPALCAEPHKLPRFDFRQRFG